MKKILFSLLCFAFISTAKAMPIIENGSFESGLSGWTSEGDVGAVSSQVVTDGAVGVTTTMLPTEGSNFARLFAGDLTSSLISDTFSINIGDQIFYDWFFSAEDVLPFNDYGRVGLTVVSAGNAVVFGAALSSVFIAGNWGLNGWNTSSFFSPVTGEVRLSFHATNLYDNDLSSIVGIDNVYVNSVPAPATLALLSLGLAGLGWIRRKKA